MKKKKDSSFAITIIKLFGIVLLCLTIATIYAYWSEKDSDTYYAVQMQPTAFDELHEQGWTEECIETKEVEKYDFVDEYEVIEEKKWCEQHTCLISVNYFWDDADALYIYNETCIEEKCQLKKPYVYYWNETVCTKMTLVKVV